MSKIHINLIGEENIDQDYDALISDDKIEYMENNVKVTILKYNDYIVMKRKCNEYSVELNLKKGNNKSYYQVFGADKKFELETVVSKFIISDDLLEIDYDLEGNKFQFKLEVKK